MSYREISDRVTAKNWDIITAVAEKRHPDPDLSFDQSATIQKGKNGTINSNGALTEAQFRALENYRRRIYDSWSVLRAANIIEKVDARHYKYNWSILEPKKADQRSQAYDTMTAQKLRNILESMN